MGTPTPVFARTKWSHVVYSDFWRLVDLSPFETCFVEEIDLAKDEFYIVTALHRIEISEIIGKKQQQLQSPKRARLAGLELEPPGWHQCKPQNRAILDYHWVMDKFLESIVPGSMHFVLGGDARVYEGSKSAQPSFDVCFLCAGLGRRIPIWHELTKSGLRMGPPHMPGPATPEDGIFGEARATLLNNSRSMLHAHQKGLQYVPHLRFSLTAAYGLPLFSERIENPWPLIPGKHFLMSQCPWVCPEGNRRGTIHLMNPTIREWVNRKDLPEMAEALKKLYTVEWTFERGIMDAVKRSLGT